MPTETVRRHVADLIAAGLIVESRRGGFRPPAGRSGASTRPGCPTSSWRGSRGSPTRSSVSARSVSNADPVQPAFFSTRSAASGVSAACAVRSSKNPSASAQNALRS
ncbi:MAG: hypothetical protein ACK4KW_03075 [Gemmobacter sp.]